MSELPRRPPRVVVIGGGFSGAAFAVHLLRDHDPEVELVVVEPAATIGAGLAYGTRDPVHRVNVAAGRMSLYTELPDDFVTWVREGCVLEGDPDAVMADGRLYPQRAAFGRYVNDRLLWVASGARAGLRHVRARAVSAVPSGAGFRVELADGESLDADLLVLAVSHTAPDLPGFLHPVREDGRVIVDPWVTDALDRVAAEDDVLVVGTGLTACDVIASLAARGHRGRIVAVSRRGLLPRPRTTRTVTAFGQFEEAPAPTALALLRRVRAAVAAAEREDLPWEGVVDALRSQARVVWSSLPVAERRRLLAHLRPFWDAHRFQSAPQIDRVIARARADGRLEVLAATPMSVDCAGSGLRVRLHPRGARATVEIVRSVAAIVNCTGPGHRSVVERHPVLRALREAGALEADACALGVAVDRASRVVRPDGSAWDRLFVVGPLARGTHGELMGLPQVSTQPREVAAMIASGLVGRVVA